MAANLNALRDISKISVKHDRKADQFCVRLKEGADQWVAEWIPDEFFIMRDAQTAEIVGYLIEDFERVFLRKHPELLAAWQDSHSIWTPWRGWSDSVQTGVKQIVVGFLVKRSSSQMPLVAG